MRSELGAQSFICELLVGVLCAWVFNVGLVIAARSEVIPYPTAPDVEASPDYLVSADGKSIFVQHTPAFSMTTFAFSGRAEIAIQVRRPIKHAVVRPLALGITPVEKAGTLCFTISQPCRLAIEVDEDLHRPLFLFANAPDADVPRAGGKHVRFFAGGKVHEAGRIELGDDDTLYVAGGAIVHGEVRATGAKGIRICGPGILDASTRTRKSKLIELDGCKDVELRDLIVLGSYGWSVVPHRCEDVRMSGVKVVSWRDNDDGFDPDSSRRVRVENCFFRTKDDCIAVKAHAARDGRDAGLAPEAFNTEDVTVTQSTFWSSEWGHALTIGFAVSAPAIRNVVFRNCDIIKKERGPAMSIDNHDLGSVENVRFEDIRLEDGCDKLLALKVAFSEYSADCPVEYFRNNEARIAPSGEGWESVLRQKSSSRRGTIRNVMFKNIQVSGDRLPGSDIRGFSIRAEIRDVLLQNITLHGKRLESVAEANLRIRDAAEVRFVQ